MHIALKIWNQSQFKVKGKDVFSVAVIPAVTLINPLRKMREIVSMSQNWSNEIQGQGFDA